MKVLSLFSGVGGFDMGLEQAGWKTAFQCEIDPQCQRVLQRHWPDVPKWDDVSTLTGKHILEQTGGVDVVAWGSPCQDLSMAGRRAGLVGDKSSLFHEGIRIIKELQELTDGTSPTLSIWENVAGAFSSNNGADFETVLCELADCRCHHLEWSVLDAQFFGVPQRRRRVFVISVFDLGIAKRCDGQVLAVSKSGRRRTQKSQQQRESVARDSVDSVATDSESIGMLFPALMDGNRIDDIRIWDDGVSPTLAAKMGTGGNNVPFVVDEGKPFFIDFAATSQGDNALYDPIIDQRDVTTCLPAARPHAVAQYPETQYQQLVNTLCASDKEKEFSNQYVADNKLIVQHQDDLPYQETIGTLCAADHKGVGNQYVNDDKVIIQRTDDVTIPIDMRNAIRQPNVNSGTGVGDDGDVSYTLTVGGEIPAVAFSHTQGLDPQPSEDAFPTLRANGSGAAVMSKLIVRRLTPKECERLMGWPDDHTRFAADGKEIADTHRYKMCGNGVASPVARWIAEQINVVLND